MNKERKREYNKKYRKTEKYQKYQSLYIKDYYEKNKEIIKERSKKHRIANKEKNKERDKEYRKIYYQKHKEKIRLYQENNKTNRLNWLKNNRDKINKARRLKIQSDINFKLSIRIRERLYCAIKENWKKGSAVRDLGCTIPELKKHIESQFAEGMTWKNWSFKGWHIDHIIPLDSFNLLDRKQFLKAVHYTNLQPMWWFDNISKGNKLSPTPVAKN